MLIVFCGLTTDVYELLSIFHICLWISVIYLQMAEDVYGLSTDVIRRLWLVHKIHRCLQTTGIIHRYQRLL